MKDTSQKLTADFATNTSRMDGRLRVAESFDVIGRNMTVGGRKARLYFIDGFVKDDLMEKIMQFLMGVKPEQMEAVDTVEAFADQFIPYVEVDPADEEETIAVQVLSGTIALLIEGYTSEAGVRNLERQIAAVCRKVAKQVVENPETAVSVTPALVEQLLGPRKYKPEPEEHEAQVGVVNGLAWTAVGGTTLPVEVAVLEGTGKIELTGNLGDVMKESAHIAVSYVRSGHGNGTLTRISIKPRIFTSMCRRGLCRRMVLRRVSR